MHMTSSRRLVSVSLKSIIANGLYLMFYSTKIWADNPDDIWIRLAGEGEVLKNRIELFKERGIRIKEVG